MFSKLAGFCAGLAVALGAWLAYPKVTGAYPPVPFDQPWPLTSRRHAATEATLDILFIGNSFTYSHGMPAMLVNMASADPGNPVRLRVWTVTAGGATLTQTWDRGKAVEAVTSRRFDYVVLNEQSGWPFYPQYAAQTREIVGRWTQLIRRRGAKPVLFETWSDGAGSGQYAQDGYLPGHTPESSQRKISEQTAELAMAYNLPVVEVGAAFARVRRMDVAPDLYDGDRHHPSVAGAYLSAATFYEFFTGRTPAQVGYRPTGLNQADAAILTGGP